MISVLDGKLFLSLTPLLAQLWLFSVLFVMAVAPPMRSGTCRLWAGRNYLSTFKLMWASESGRERMKSLMSAALCLLLIQLCKITVY